MCQKHFFLIGACVVALLSWSRPASSKPRPRRAQRACENAYKRAGKLEQSGQLLKAQEELQNCTRSVCGKFLQHQCTVRYDQIVSDTPSVVPIVADADGAPIIDVHVTMDGAPLTSRIDGRAIPIDPGLHEFSFEQDKTVIGTQKIVILQGQRNHPLSVKLRRPKEEARQELPPASAVRDPAAKAPEKRVPPAALSELPAEEPRRGSSLGPYLLIGSGLMAIGGYGLLTYWGRQDNDKLAMCTPNCSQASVDHIHDLYLAANISLSAGIVAVVTGGWFVWRNHSRYAMSVEPTPSGAYASVGGIF